MIFYSMAMAILHYKPITMKNLLFLVLLIMATTFSVNAQGIVGTYKQDALNAPKNFAQSGKNLVVTRDPKFPNKYWISNLIPGQTFYAMASTGNEDKSSFNIPAQKAGTFQIQFGCIVYDTEESQIVVSLNNKVDCAGVAVTINGALKAAQKGTSEILKGVQYIGNKIK